MTHEQSNAKMRLTIDTQVVGQKITAFRIEGRSVKIEMETGYTCSFSVVEHFDLIGPGKWVFVPNHSPGRPKKASDGPTATTPSESSPDARKEGKDNA